MSYWGDFPLEETLNFLFTTRAFATGVPTVLAGTPVLSVYEDTNLTQITAGVTITADHDSVVGLNRANVVATAANGYESGKTYTVVITTGTVGGVSVVGEVVGTFTIDRSAALKPTVAGRTLDVSATGEAGMDWANVGSPTTSVTLSGTTVGTTTTNTDMRGTDSALLAASAPANFGDLSISATTGLVDILQTAADKVWGTTARILTASTNFNDLSAAEVNTEVDTALADVNLDHLVGTATGIPALPAGTYFDQMLDDGTAVFDRTTDSLQAIADSGGGGPTAAQIADAVLDEALSGHVTAGSLGKAVADIETDATAILVDTGTTIPATLGTPAADISADIAAVKVDTAATLVDTAQIGVAGAGLTDLGGMSTGMKAEVNAEALDVLNTDTITLPGQVAPPLAPTHREAISWLYKVFRNRKTQTATQWSLLADDESTVDAKSTVSDDGTTAIKQEVVTGP